MSASIKGSHVAIVGGSIAGCSTAIALKDAGVAKVTVLERSSSNHLQDRGLGIGLPKPMQELLLNSGYLGKGYKFVQTKERQWFVKDTDGDESWRGRQAWSQPIPVQLHNWGLLWKELRERVDDYRGGVTVKELAFKDTGVELKGEDGASLGTFDFVVGADGASSFLHDLLNPNSQPNYSGYVLWRGSYPMDELKCQDHDYFLRNKVWTTVGFENGHGIFYAIPSSADDNGGYLINWAVYTHTPPGLEFTTPTVVRDVPPEAMRFFQETVREGLPPYFLELVTSSSTDVSIHPVFDDSPKSMTHEGSNRILLVGDACATLRPHTASGTTKALKDAMAVGKLCKEKLTWAEVCETYQQERKSEADTRCHARIPSSELRRGIKCRKRNMQNGFRTKLRSKITTSGVMKEQLNSHVYISTITM